jgi:uncharacterized protein (TIGR00266 family)
MDSNLTVACTACGKRYQATPDLIGQTLQCRACGSAFHASAETSEQIPFAETAPPHKPDGFAGSGHGGQFDPTTAGARSAFAGGGREGSRADTIDYEIFGEEMQYVEVTLDPGEQTVAEAGALMYMDGSIVMDTVFGDPSETGGGFWAKAMGAGKRVLTGESLFMTTFTNQGSRRAKVAFGSPYAGRMVPMHLDELGGEIICQKGAFLCAARGVKVDIAFQKKFGAGLLGGEGFIMQRLRGDGVAITHAGGTMMYRNLGPGETLRVDTGCLMALGSSVNYDVQLVGGIKNTLFGGEGLVLATVTGPGPVWLQSLPFSRLAERVQSSGSGGRDRGEGSILGGLGDMVMGD